MMHKYNFKVLIVGCLYIQLLWKSKALKGTKILATRLEYKTILALILFIFTKTTVTQIKVLYKYEDINLYMASNHMKNP